MLTKENIINAVNIGKCTIQPYIWMRNNTDIKVTYDKLEFTYTADSDNWDASTEYLSDECAQEIADIINRLNNTDKGE